MPIMFLRRAFLVWFIVIAVETVHGILRTLLLVPIMDWNCLDRLSSVSLRICIKKVIYLQYLQEAL